MTGWIGGLMVAAGKGEVLPDWTRRLASSIEVAESNKVQADNALRDLIAQAEAELAPFKV